jgi:transposase-like protein
MKQRRTRRTFTSAERIQIVLEGLQDGASVSEVCRRHQISPTLFYRWHTLLLENADRVFVKRDPSGAEQHQATHEAEVARLKSVIAELTAENLELKKTPGGWRTGPGFRGSSGQ